ncbi:23S rRNA pseudouridine1911/1915/1917 synthase [Anaerobacterium chartisolvens]|uniref:Pseudouridine synthase n=1 Tax=Anaerobacterium chartisolvens TaxID=1297424 RepID=A0A369B8E0_9FIRM|nr:RluA family pseudouridine synthase [Anaerobacterium chartisolvens]RCX16816.1 23S rRNA pseudouridine1911/1915/1917 synthase [Anaerobacterium chartisolvens]
MNIKYIVDEQHSGKTVKFILKNIIELSERFIKRLKNSGGILCNSAPAYVNSMVKNGDIIEVLMDFTEESEDIIPQNLGINIIFEDEWMIALDKPPHMVVHPTFNYPSGTVANAVCYYLRQKGEFKKIRPVSRLDRDTSGIIVFAKNPFVQEALIRQMKDKTFSKEYMGVVYGNMEQAEGTIDLPIDRKPGSIITRHIAPSGMPSVTHYSVLESLNNFSLLRFKLETGRTHQIRVHCQAIGHPIVGDSLYPHIMTEPGSPCLPAGVADRQALHSYKVCFIHPFSKKVTELAAPLPKDIKNLLEILRK